MYSSILRLSLLFVKLAEELATVDVAKAKYPTIPPEFNLELLDTKTRDILHREQFNYEEFSELQTLKEIKEYADKTLFPVSSEGKPGSSRMVYDLGNEVLKVAINHAGIAQNNMEARIQNRNPLFAKVLDMQQRAIWIIAEKIYPFRNEEEFTYHTGIPTELLNSQWFTEVLHYYKFRKGIVKDLKKYNLSDDAIEILSNIGDIISMGVISGDARNPEHWGLNKQGELKLFDFGLDSTMHSTFYTEEGFLRQ
jgi:hypothetical protein